MERLSESAVHMVCSAQVIPDLKSCVKELVENCLDACATDILVRLRDLGRGDSVIEVVDNGSGIAPENRPLICAPHATSKITEFSDIYGKVSSFGFRGEALASLCGLCDEVRVYTRTRLDNVAAGLRFGSNGKVVEKLADIPRGIGTTVEVRGFFGRVPVRQKDFISNHKKQISSVLSYIQQYAVTRFNVSFDLYNDGKLLLRTRPQENPFKAAESVFGFDSKFWKMIDSNDSPKWSLNGWIGDSGNSKIVQYQYLNNKPIEFIMKISKSISATYKLFENTKPPSYILFITIDSKEVDINVSPDKRTVLIPAEIEQDIAKALEVCLKTAWNTKVVQEIPNSQPINRMLVSPINTKKRQLSPQESFKSRQESSDQLIDDIQRTESRTPPTMRTTRYNVSNKSEERLQESPGERPRTKIIKRLSLSEDMDVEQGNGLDEPQNDCCGHDHGQRLGPIVAISHKPVTTRSCDFFTAQRDLPVMDPFEKSVIVKEFRKDFFNDFTVLGQFNNGFIVCKHEDSLYLVDQHAADEKYRFEQLERSHKIDMQPLVIPKCLKLSPAQENIVAENCEIFVKNGFNFDFNEKKIPGERVSLTALPSLTGLGVERSATFGLEEFHEIIDALQDDDSSETIRPKKILSHLASRACRTAIMIGDNLTSAEMSKIVKNLSCLSHPWTCPHGRPTFKYIGRVSVVQQRQEQHLSTSFISQSLGL